MTVAARLYRTLGRIVPCDVTVVLLLDARRSTPVEPGTSPPATLAFALLDEAAVAAGAAAGTTGFAAAVPDADTGGTSRCAVALHGRELVGHAWFAREHVPAAANTGGHRFTGIGLRLPASTAYLFKVHVVPGWRGCGLASALIAHGVRALPAPGADTIVTTTDFTNMAFRRGVARLGFERRDWAAEIVLGKRHLHRLPAALASPGGGEVTFFGGASAGRPSGDAARRHRG